MNEPELTATVDMTPLEEPPAEPAAPPAPADDLPPELPEQDRVAAAFNAMRREIQELRPLKASASEAERLRAELAATQPYVEFLKANPQLLQAQPQPAPAAAPAEPSGPDPQLVKIAKLHDYYDASGQLDLTRAAEWRDLQRSLAQSAAQSEVAPYAQQTNEQRAGANLTAAMAAAEANGTPIEEQYLTAAVRSVTGQVPRAQAVKILADPNVTNLLTLTALGLQAAAKKGAPPAAPVAQPGPVLEVERPGGAPAVRMSDESRRLFSGTGINEEKYTEAAKRYVPGRSNALE